MKKIQFFAVTVFLFSLLLLSGSRAQAATRVTGWAWTSNIGWISFSSTNSGIPAGPSYDVQISTSSADVNNAAFSGYAWAPNMGWISFNQGDVIGCPTTQLEEDNPGTTTDNRGAPFLLTGNVSPSEAHCLPRMNLMSGKVSGWARVLTLKNATDGSSWLHLSGTNHRTKVTGVSLATTTGALTGYAYEQGVLGWVNFMGSISVAPPSNNLQAYCQAASPFTKPGLAVHVATGGGDVRFGAYPYGGVSPYTYNWGDAMGFINSNEITISYTAPITQGPNVVVRDANGLISPAVQCPTVVVGDGGAGLSTDPLPVGAFKLLIGPSGTALPDKDYDDTKSTHKRYQVVQGNPFAIKWNMNISPSYDDCKLRVEKGSYPSWDGFNVFNSGTETHQALDGNSTSLATGDYTFRLRCVKTSDLSSISSSVDLKIIKSSIIHF
jgi:hypothetical protein